MPITVYSAIESVSTARTKIVARSICLRLGLHQPRQCTRTCIGVARYPHLIAEYTILITSIMPINEVGRRRIINKVRYSFHVALTRRQLSGGGQLRVGCRCEGVHKAKSCFSPAKKAVQIFPS